MWSCTSFTNSSEILLGRLAWVPRLSLVVAFVLNFLTKKTTRPRDIPCTEAKAVRHTGILFSPLRMMYLFETTRGAFWGSSRTRLLLGARDVIRLDKYESCSALSPRLLNRFNTDSFRLPMRSKQLFLQSHGGPGSREGTKLPLILMYGFPAALFAFLIFLDHKSSLRAFLLLGLFTSWSPDGPGSVIVSIFNENNKLIQGDNCKTINNENQIEPTAIVWGNTWISPLFNNYYVVLLLELCDFLFCIK